MRRIAAKILAVLLLQECCFLSLKIVLFGAELIEQDASMVFDDVVDDFCTIKSVLDRFQSWRVTDWDSYTEAYVSLCIPKVLSPLLKLELLFWNPLQVSIKDLSTLYSDQRIPFSDLRDLMAHLPKSFTKWESKGL